MKQYVRKLREAIEYNRTKPTQTPDYRVIEYRNIKIIILNVFNRIKGKIKNFSRKLETIK